MRNLLLTLTVLLFSARLSHAQLFADFTTSLGNFTCELNYTQTPRTVGNFVSLAEGSRAWCDERTGVVSSVKPPVPFFPGITFHRVINNADFKIIQAGSKKADGSDGPGYSFPDEMSAAVPATFKFDQPYYLAMANSGPNTNGSQFFITGGPIPGLEGKHTVFGKVVTGQSVIDGILATPVDSGDKPITPVTITAVVIRRVGSAAGKFKATSQRLPIVTVPTVKSQPAPEANTTRYFFTQAVRNDLLPFASLGTAQAEWQLLEHRWHAPAPYSIRYFDITYPAGSPITGFRPVLVKYGTDALGPISLGGWSISMENSEGVYLFSFPLAGAMGYMFTPTGSTTSQTGAVRILGADFHPYRATLVLEVGAAKRMRLQLGFDSKSKNNLVGRCVSSNYNFLFGYQEVGGDKGFVMIPIR